MGILEESLYSQYCTLFDFDNIKIVDDVTADFARPSRLRSIYSNFDAEVYQQKLEKKQIKAEETKRERRQSFKTSERKRINSKTFDLVLTRTFDSEQLSPQGITECTPLHREST